MRDQVLNSLKWVAIGKMLGQSIRWLTTIFTLRLLFPEDYTVIALGAFFSSLLWSVSTGGIASALIREKDLSVEKTREFFTFMIMAHVLFFILLQFSSPYIAEFYANPSVEPALQVTSFGFLIVLIGITQQTHLNRNMQFKRLSMIDAICESIGSISTLALAYYGMGFWSIIAGNLIATSLRQFGYIWATKLVVLPSKITKSVTNMIAFAKRASFHGVLAHVSNNIDIAIAGILMTAYEVGIYQFAVVVAMMPASKVMPLIRQVAFPAYSKLQDSKDSQRWYFLKSIRLAYFVFVPVFWGLAACSLIAVPLIFGEKWSEAAIVMLVYCLSMPLRSGNQMFSPLLKSSNHLFTMISNMVISICVLVPCFYLLGNSPVGMGYAWLVGYFICYLITSTRSCRALDIPLRKKWASIVYPFIAGAIMFVATFYAGERMLDLGLSPLVTLLGQIALGGFTYIGALFVMNKAVLIESIDLLRKKKPIGA